MPVKTGIEVLLSFQTAWIPASAGMTD